MPNNVLIDTDMPIL